MPPPKRSYKHLADERVWLVDNPDDLMLIHQPGIKAVIWQRGAQISHSEQLLINNMPLEDLFSLPALFEKMAMTAQDYALPPSFPKDPGATLFIKDIYSLAALFNKVSGENITPTPENILINSHYSDSLLSHDTQDNWPEHHAELGYKLRLISPFAGRGTEWISGDLSYEDLRDLNKNNLIENHWSSQRHHYLNTRDVIILKGDQYKPCKMTDSKWSPDWLVHREPLPQPGKPRMGIVMPYF